ncbi:MAG: hypothetical protein R2873_14775 [Caldilineaceae bacterium]
MGNITNTGVLSPRGESYLRMDFAKGTVELTHLYSYRNESAGASAACPAQTPTTPISPINGRARRDPVLARRPVDPLPRRHTAQPNARPSAAPTCAP